MWVIMYPDFPRSVPIYVYSAGVIITGISFYSKEFQLEQQITWQIFVQVAFIQINFCGVENVLTIVNGIHINLEAEENITGSKNTTSK